MDSLGKPPSSGKEVDTLQWLQAFSHTVASMTRVSRVLLAQT